MAEAEKKRKKWQRKENPDTYTIAYKFRIYPNRKQAHQIICTCGCKRAVYNHFLALRRNEWKANHHSLSYADTNRLLTELKRREGFLYLKDADSMALQEALRDLDTAYKNFFEGRSDYPKFKAKKQFVQSYRTRNQTGNIRIIGKEILLPKLGAVKIKQHRNFDGRILNATVKKTADGQFHVLLCVEIPKAQMPERHHTGKSIGIDVGLTEFYTDSEGNVVENPKYYRKLHRKLAREQRKLARKMPGSHNQEKQRIRKAKADAKIQRKRKDMLNKLTHNLATTYDTVAVEHLHIRGMLKNHKLAKSISDAAWGEFFRQLAYKMPLYGGELLKVDTYFPSSQTCHVCRYKNPLVKDLKVREWDCPKCHTHHGRDCNAAKNILAQALKDKAKAQADIA